MNVSPNFESNADNITDNTTPQSADTTLTISVITTIKETAEDSQSSESSRDSGTASPPTPLAISAAEELTEEEYASLPSLVNLSHNEWDLYVVIDPKTLSVLSTDLNAVSISGEENSCMEECQSSLANINKVIEDTNNYIFATKSTAYLRQSTNATDFMINPNDNYWSSESSPFYTLTAIKPRTSLPLSYVDNQCSQDLSNGCSPLISSLKDRTSVTGISDNSLCIFGALKSCANINTNSNSVNHSIAGSVADSSLKKLSKVFGNSSLLKAKANSHSLSAGSHRQKSGFVFRQNSLLRRLSLDNNRLRTPSKMSVQRLASSLQKRKHSPDYSPPSKHLRSSLWRRKPLATKEQISFTRSLKQLAVGRLTRSRLRPMKLLKAFHKK